MALKRFTKKKHYPDTEISMQSENESMEKLNFEKTKLKIKKKKINLAVRF